jgi:hypothetical protein
MYTSNAILATLPQVRTEVNLVVSIEKATQLLHKPYPIVGST